MKRMLACLMVLFMLGALLTGCHTIYVQPGAPAPRIALNPATSYERRYLPHLAHYFQRAGYQVVYSLPAEYELDFNVHEHRIYVGSNMNLYKGTRLIATGEGQVGGHFRMGDRTSVALAAIDEALADLNPPVVVY